MPCYGVKVWTDCKTAKAGFDLRICRYLGLGGVVLLALARQCGELAIEVAALERAKEEEVAALVALQGALARAKVALASPSADTKAWQHSIA